VRTTQGQRGEQLPLETVSECIEASELLALQDLASQVRVDERVIDYAVRIGRATRGGLGLAAGSGPRGAIAMVRAARAAALLAGRDFVTPDDVKRCALPALRHRVPARARRATGRPTRRRADRRAARDGRGAAALNPATTTEAPMALTILPTRAAIAVVAALAVASAAALLAHVAPTRVAAASAIAAVLCIAVAVVDVWASRRAWRAAPLRWQRHLPPALAVGVRRVIEGHLVNEGARRWRVALFDHIDPSFDVDGLPIDGVVDAESSLTVRYEVLPRRRGEARFEPAELRVRTLAGSFDMRIAVGDAAKLRVYPNFAAVSRYAWLAGDRRLAEIGIKSYPMRGSGTDFKQLADYRPGDAIRDIDWKATLRQGRPIVREYQDERDQSVVFLLDCGRRMRADEGSAARAAATSTLPSTR
jgi:hypothetical protein